MPPSSPLIALYSVDHDSTPNANTVGTNVAVSCSRDLDNTCPTSRHADESSSSMSSDSEQRPTMTAGVAPFLEMEEENETDKNILEEIPLKDDEVIENSATTTAAAGPLSDRRMPLEEEKKDDDDNYDPGAVPVAFVRRARAVSCGKRPRNSRRVSFAPMVHWSIRSTSRLQRVRSTIHISEFTAEERMATWYTYNDLRSFKRDRKATALQIDNGFLVLRQSIEHIGHNDVYTDTTSFSEPVVYCSRGVENCTESISRIRYRHISDGWRSVLNTQEKHNYRKQKLSSMSSSEKDEYNVLVSLLGAGRINASRKNINTINRLFPYGTNKSPKSRPKISPQNSRKNIFDHMCCPYDLAAAYIPSSEASLDIARNRAIVDERDVLAQRAQDRLEHEAAGISKEENNDDVDDDDDNTVIENLDSSTLDATITSASLELNTGRLTKTIVEQIENRCDNNSNKNCDVVTCESTAFVKGKMRTMDL